MPALSPLVSASSIALPPSMDAAGISLRTFHSTNPSHLNHNRLRESERSGENGLLHESFEPNANFSSYNGFMEHFPHEQPHSSTSAAEGVECDEDEEVTSTMNGHTSAPHSSLMPTKSHVLFFLSSSPTLLLHRAGTEIQVTDASNFPLFDIWAEKMWCGGGVWVMESYGRRVVQISDLPTSSSAWRRRSSHSLQAVHDWNDQVLGYFLPGDPFLVQNAQRETIARCVCMGGVEGGRESWECVIEDGGREAATLHNRTLNFSPQLSFTFKLLLLAALTRLLTTPRSSRSCFSFLRP